MVFYHLTRAEKVPTYLQEGISRSGGRIYVFDQWDDILLFLEALALEAQAPQEFEQNVVLVLDLDRDVVIPGPIPRVQIPRAIRPVAVEDLQTRSAYVETDVAAQRITAVKDVQGDPLHIAPARKRRSSLWRFLAYVRPYWLYVAGATAAGLGKFLLPLVFPAVLRIILDDVVLDTATPLDERRAHLFQLILFVLGVNVLWMAACYLRGIYTAKAGHQMIRDLRVDLFNHVQRLSHHFFSSHQTGAIVSRVVNDIAQAQNFVGAALTNVWMDGALLFILLGVLFNLNVELTLVSIALLPIFFISVRYIGNHIRLVSREVQQRVEILSGGLQEKIAGVSVVKGFAREDAETRAFATQTHKLYSKVLTSVRYSAINEMIVGFCLFTAPVLVTWYGARLIMQGELTVGELTQFLLYLGMFYAPLQRLSDMTTVLATALAAIDRIFEYFDTHPHVAEKPDARVIDHADGRVVFDHVWFGYEADAPILKDIHFVVEPGETVALVGPSGSGKSTLANIIPRFYDPTQGAVYLDGQDLRDLNLASLRKLIGIVSQETILFSGTIRENLLLANPEATPDQMMEALRAANALEFVEELSEGLWTEIGERGAKLSGGQKQRLAIARAFLKDPRILILDEATSALDSKSERYIQEALERLLVGRTSFVIAHRLSTILNADKIAVIERGRIVEMSDHRTLLANGGLYAQLYEEQFSRALAAE